MKYASPQITAFIAALVFAAILMCGCDRRAHTEEKPLTILIIKDSPPMSYRDANGAWVGFYIDMATALCADLKRKCETKETLVSSVVDQISNGEGDVGFAGLAITAEREKKVIFTEPYRKSKTFWVSQDSIENSKSMRVAVVQGSFVEEWVNSEKSKYGWSVIPVAKNAELASALLERKAEAAVSPLMSAMYITSHSEMKSRGVFAAPIPDERLSLPVGLAVSPSNKELRDEINDSLRNLISSGEMDRINSKYFPFRIF